MGSQLFGSLKAKHIVFLAMCILLKKYRYILLNELWLGKQSLIISSRKVVFEKQNIPINNLFHITCTP